MNNGIMDDPVCRFSVPLVDNDIVFCPNEEIAPRLDPELARMVVFTIGLTLTFILTTLF